MHDNIKNERMGFKNKNVNFFLSSHWNHSIKLKSPSTICVYDIGIIVSLSSNISIQIVPKYIFENSIGKLKKKFRNNGGGLLNFFVLEKKGGTLTLQFPISLSSPYSIFRRKTIGSGTAAVYLSTGQCPYWPWCWRLSRPVRWRHGSVEMNY